MAHENGKSENDLFIDKTQLTAYNCTIQINCPSGVSSDGGSASTEVKKMEIQAGARYRISGD